MTSKPRLIMCVVSLLIGSSAAPAFASSITSGDRATYFYGPEPASLTGVVKTIIFPGPPGYESIKTGDQPEPSLILFLDRPISILPKEGKGDFEEPARDVQRLHLVIHSDRNVKIIKEQYVRVTGTFFSKHTGHHHTDVLMEVDRIEVAK